MAAKKIPLEIRFWSKVDKNGPVVSEELGECWMWTASSGGGCPTAPYGNIKIDGRTHYSHRVSYELTFGEIPKQPDGRLSVIDHKCNNTLCVRPDHLSVMNQGDNNRKRSREGRDGPKPNRPRMSDEQVLDVKEMILNGARNRDIVTKYGCSGSLVSTIRNGHQRSDITGFPKKYVR